MSVCFRILGPGRITVAMLGKFVHPENGLIWHPDPHRPGHRAIHDGLCYLWVEPYPSGWSVGFEIFVALVNDPSGIIAQLEDEFGVEIIDEHDPRYF